MATAPGKGTTFIVHLDGIDLGEKERSQLARAIQGVALSEAARFDVGGTMGFQVPNKEWLGLWLERLAKRDIPALQVMVGKIGGPR